MTSRMVSATSRPLSPGHSISPPPMGLGAPAPASPRPQHQPGHDGRAERVELELEGGGDAEVAPAAVQRPEEVGVLVAAGPDGDAVGGDELDGAEVVAGQAVLALQPARAAAEGE